jgi:hypothetical protein
MRKAINFVLSLALVFVGIAAVASLVVFGGAYKVHALGGAFIATLGAFWF